MREYDGYRYDFAYNHDYHPELSPTFLQMLSGRRANAAAPPLRYLELGYGTGVALNIHVAATPGEYWGTDISPQHATEANGLAEAAGLELRALELSFADLLKRPDLPQFDVIAAHGVWSWVSPSNRNLIVELARRHLVDGGLFFFNAVAMPGEAEVVPLQRLMRAQNVDDPREALALADALRAVGSRYFSPDRRATNQLAALQNASPSYISHEYLNEHWQPCLFDDTAQQLAAAGLRFLTSVRLFDRFDELNFTPAQCELLRSIGDPLLRETARDFLRLRRHRNDVFIKADDVPVSHIQEDQEFILIVPSPAVPGEFDIERQSAVVEKLAADDYRPKRLHELGDAQALFALLDIGLVLPARSGEPAPQTRDACSRLNAEILRRAETDDSIVALASPITGGGVRLSNHQCLFMQALRQGARTPDAWARFAQGLRQVPTPALLKEALYFQTRLPVLKALGLL